MFKTVVVGADDSTTARNAVMIAVELTAVGGGTLHIVTAYREKPYSGIGNVPQEFRYSSSSHSAQEVARALAAMARSQGVEAAVHIAAGDATEAIVKIAREVNADLIVVGNQGMKGVRRVLGSIPNSVAHSAQCSVLIAETGPV